jgi:perosamine synthetase
VERVHAPTDAAGRAASVRAAVARLVVARPQPLEVLSSERDHRAGLRCDRHVFASGRRAVVLAPGGEPGPWPAVLVVPGRNATLERVTGLEPPDHPDRDVAVQLARAGLLTLTVDHRDGGAAGASDEALDAVHRLCGSSLLAASVQEALAAFAWLEEHPDVVPRRTGLFGHSSGAAVALHTALLIGSAVPTCTASHLGGYREMLARPAAWSAAVALPGILRHADLPDLYAALAPAPLQVQYGKADPRISAEAGEAGARIEAGYRAAGAAEHVEVLQLPMGHGTGIAEATEFFRHALAAPRPAPPVPAARTGFDVVDRLEVLDLVDEALASGRLTLGPHGARLEELAAHHLTRPAAAVSSGSAALEIALRIVGVQDRTVLVPTTTFFATAAGAVRAGARVDVVDMELEGLGLDPEALRAVLDDHDDVAAVVAVHIAGVVSPHLAEVRAECARRGVALVEDAAHAIGASLDGQPAGTFGRLATFSFYPTKVITSGEGGLVAADGADLDRVRNLRDHGKRSFHENLHTDLGSNWRMSELHAAVGLTHMARLHDVLAERSRLAAWYDEHLADVPRLVRHAVPAGVVSNHYKYVADLADDVDRADLKRRLRERGVAMSGEVYDVPLHRQPYFADAFGGSGARRTYPRAEWFAAHHVCLPLFPGMTAEQQERVVRELREALS